MSVHIHVWGNGVYEFKVLHTERHSYFGGTPEHYRIKDFSKILRCFETGTQDHTLE